MRRLVVPDAPQGWRINGTPWRRNTKFGVRFCGGEGVDRPETRSQQNTRSPKPRRQLRQETVKSPHLVAIPFTHPSRQQGKMRALLGLLLVSIGLNLTPSASRSQELGRCDPTKAVQIIDAALSKGKTLEQAMQLMIKAKVFDGSKACITFIRETSMSMRDPYPNAFESLWMN